MKRTVLICVSAAALCLSSGCVFTKILTVPMRIVASVVSIVPVVGNTGHDAIDQAAETVDDLPF
jgi:hypothetical protein